MYHDALEVKSPMGPYKYPITTLNIVAIIGIALSDRLIVLAFVITWFLQEQWYYGLMLLAQFFLSFMMFGEPESTELPEGGRIYHAFRGSLNRIR